jgi:hypothetical protein
MSVESVSLVFVEFCPSRVYGVRLSRVCRVESLSHMSVESVFLISVKSVSLASVEL